MHLGEFVALAALLTSLTALSTDAMLPALPDIARDLAAGAGNDVQLVVSTLLIGLGVGQLFCGPLSDSIGRKGAIGAGVALFVVGCVLAIRATTFETMLLGRFLQGIGSSGPRIVTIALVRDQFEGRAMARVMSFVMAVFILVPALAPALGQGILLVAGWRAIFATFLAIALVAVTWLALRQPETLAVERRRPFTPRAIAAAVREVCTTRVAIGYTFAAGFVFAPFVGYLSSAQQVFQDTYGVGTRFPAYFATLALAIGTGSIVNARVVGRYGMQRPARAAAAVLAMASIAFWLLARHLGGAPPLWSFMAYFMVAFVCIGMLFGNLNALAMEPLGHIAGVGAAVVGSLSALLSVPVGALIGRGYDGTVLALVGGFAVLASAALATMLWVERGRERAGTT